MPLITGLLTRGVLGNWASDLERDPEAARDVVRRTGQTGVPVIKIGNRWIVGFDKERIEKELGLN